MTYFNLDLMERDAKRRLAKSIEASVKIHLAEFTESCKTKPVLDAFSGWRVIRDFNKPFIIHAGVGGSGYGQQHSNAGGGLWSGL